MPDASSADIRRQSGWHVRWHGRHVFMKRFLVGLFVTSLGALLMFAGGDRWRPPSEAESLSAQLTLSGRVVDAAGPVQGARVRIKGRSASTLTDRRGQFLLPLSAEGVERVTASKTGYLIQGIAPGSDPLWIDLQRLPLDDYVGYHWVDPTPNPSERHQCGNCHQQIFDEWHRSGHANSAGNRRFLSLYQGTDWNGRPGHGWNLMADHPLGIGVCAACHAPGIDFEGGATDDMRHVSGVAAQGVHCDFCHKIQDVDSDGIGLTHGRYGYQLLRPREGQLFFGPLDDVDRGEDVFSPLQSESRYCAACHEGVVFGIHVYSTYSEWLDSPARRQGRQCQTCHMAPTGNMTNMAPGGDGIERDPATLSSHTFLPGGLQQMLRESIEVDVTLEQRGDSLQCTVTLLARDAGHRVPTGFIDRHLLLVVEPLDTRGRRLKVTRGPTLPDVAGERLTGLSGRVFARRLVDESGNGPVPFWRAAKVAHDTRLFPGETETTLMELPAITHRVRVRVLYRRFWQTVTLAKRWPDDTTVVFDRYTIVETSRD